jgi:hypothetical protein
MYRGVRSHRPQVDEGELNENDPVAHKIRCRQRASGQHPALRHFFTDTLIAWRALALIPSVQNVSLRFAIDRSARELADGLEFYGNVERVPNLESLERRVERYDDVPGIYKTNDVYVLLLQGNEKSGIVEAAETILTKVAGRRPARGIRIP